MPYFTESDKERLKDIHSSYVRIDDKRVTSVRYDEKSYCYVVETESPNRRATTICTVPRYLTDNKAISKIVADFISKSFNNMFWLIRQIYNLLGSVEKLKEENEALKKELEDRRAKDAKEE